MPTIAEELAAGLPDWVRLGTAVTGLDWSGSAVRVTAGERGYRARRVVLAVPPALSARIAFTPALTA